MRGKRSPGADEALGSMQASLQQVSRVGGGVKDSAPLQALPPIHPGPIQPRCLHACYTGLCLHPGFWALASSLEAVGFLSSDAGAHS